MQNTFRLWYLTCQVPRKRMPKSLVGQNLGKRTARTQMERCVQWRDTGEEQAGRQAHFGGKADVVLGC